MPKKLVDLEVHAVAGVDKAANKRKFLIVKRANDAPTLRERLARLFKVDESDEPIAFDQALALSNMDDQWWRLNDALRTSIQSIIDSGVEDKAALIRESVAQYAEAVLALANRMGQTAGGAAMQKMHEALMKLTDACEKGAEPWDRALKHVEERAQAWRAELEKGDTNMAQTKTESVDLDAILKDVSEEVKTAVKAAFAKQEETLAELRQKVDDLSKRDGDRNANEINKADLPEPVRKRLEDLEKQAKLAEEIAKAEREARVKAEIKKRAESYANVGAVEKIAKALYEAQERVSEEFARELEELFKSAHERIAKGDLFKEFGSGNAALLSDDPLVQFNHLVQKVADEDKIGYDEAARRVAKSHPELAAAYANSAPVGDK